MQNSTLRNIVDSPVLSPRTLTHSVSRPRRRRLRLSAWWWQWRI